MSMVPVHIIKCNALIINLQFTFKNKHNSVFWSPDIHSLILADGFN